LENKLLNWLGSEVGRIQHLLVDGRNGVAENLLFASVVDPHWFQCESVSSCLSQCRFIEPNQCRSHKKLNFTF